MPRAPVLRLNRNRPNEIWFEFRYKNRELEIMVARKTPSARSSSTHVPKEQQRRQPMNGFSLGAIIALILLLILPGAAAYRLCPPLDIRWLLGYWLAISTITHVVYRIDKKRAELGEWRTPESTLHLLELLGGWAAAFLAQREFRHKISKRSFQDSFWAIVVLYQILAGDFLLGWRLSRMLWRFVVKVVQIGA